MREIADVGSDGLDVVFRRIDRYRRDAEGYQNSCNRRMYAGIEKQKPYECSYAKIENLALDSQFPAQCEDAKEESGNEKHKIIDFCAIEDGNDEDAADVVHDCKGRKEYLQRDRYSFPEHGQHS